MTVPNVMANPMTGQFPRSGEGPPARSIQMGRHRAAGVQGGSDNFRRLATAPHLVGRSRPVARRRTQLITRAPRPEPSTMTQQLADIAAVGPQPEVTHIPRCPPLRLSLPNCEDPWSDRHTNFIAESLGRDPAASSGSHEP